MTDRIDLPGGWYFEQHTAPLPWFDLYYPDGTISYGSGLIEKDARAFAAAIRPARAALLDAFAVKDAEIERLTEINRKLCADFNLLNRDGAKLDAALAAKDAEIERLTADLSADRWSVKYLRDRTEKAEAELVRLKAARVPEELRKLDELARPRGRVSYRDRFDPAFYQHRFQQAAVDFVRSLLASEAAPAQAGLDAAIEQAFPATLHMQCRAEKAEAELVRLKAARVPEELRKLSEKSRSGEWFVEHGATDDGLSRVDDGTESGMFPLYGEVPEIELAATSVNFVRSLLASEAAPAQAGQTRHGSAELDEDAAKLVAMGQDPGPTLADLGLPPASPSIAHDDSKCPDRGLPSGSTI